MSKAIQTDRQEARMTIAGQLLRVIKLSIYLFECPTRPSVLQYFLNAALLAISHLLVGLHNDVLPSLSLNDIIDLNIMSGNITDIGLDYMHTAAASGDVSSMVYLSKYVTINVSGFAHLPMAADLYSPL